MSETQLPTVAPTSQPLWQATAAFRVPTWSSVKSQQAVFRQMNEKLGAGWVLISVITFGGTTCFYVGQPAIPPPAKS